jgi:tRNA U34 2-thiouridine synthase MnmA/TrmU
MPERRIKAVGMFSGGLDSALAVRVMLEQGIEVTALHYRTGFSFRERDRAVDSAPAEPSDAERMAAQLGVPLEVIDISEAYLPVVLEPRYGYGSGMNPCVDCRIFLLRQARAWMERHDYHFVFTGEVVGQRPKSQKRPQLRTVERESGLEGYLLRPLSAKLLPPTIPEQRGWVDRARLYGFSGRGRKAQIALAETFGLTDYPQPSGGCCMLINRVYSRRLEDFLAHEGGEALDTERVQLLAVGRHFRLPSGHKVVVGRHEAENEYLERRDGTGVFLRVIGYPGPTTLVPGDPDASTIEIAARMTASYSDAKQEARVRVQAWRAPGTDVAELVVTPIARDQMKEWMI